MEVAVGIEPTNKSFADSGLTTWLRHHRRWSGRRDLNSRPPPWQGGALPLSYSRNVLIICIEGILADLKSVYSLTYLQMNVKLILH